MKIRSNTNQFLLSFVTEFSLLIGLVGIFTVGASLAYRWDRLEPSGVDFYISLFVVSLVSATIGVLSAYKLRKASLSRDEFKKLLEESGFNVFDADKKEIGMPRIIIGQDKFGIYFQACVSLWKISDWILGSNQRNGIKNFLGTHFYMERECPFRFDHSVIKKGREINISIRGPGYSGDTESSQWLQEFVAKQCGDIASFNFNLLTNTNTVVFIGFGPKSLIYSHEFRVNLPHVVEAIRRLVRNLGRSGDGVVKTEKLSRLSLERKIRDMEKSFPRMLGTKRPKWIERKNAV